MEGPATQSADPGQLRASSSKRKGWAAQEQEKENMAAQAHEAGTCQEPAAKKPRAEPAGGAPSAVSPAQPVTGTAEPSDGPTPDEAAASPAGSVEAAAAAAASQAPAPAAGQPGSQATALPQSQSPTAARTCFADGLPDWCDRPLYLKENLQEDEEVERFNYVAGLPLTAVAAEGKTDLVKAILRQGCCGVVDAVDNNGNTALHLAAKYGRTEIVDVLLAAGAHQVRNKQGVAPGDLAAEGGHTEAASLLQQAAEAQQEGDEGGSPPPAAD